jgi:hypothetical protein
MFDWVGGWGGQRDSDMMKDNRNDLKLSSFLTILKSISVTIIKFQGKFGHISQSVKSSQAQ